jgi:hypothetical protein
MASPVPQIVSAQSNIPAFVQPSLTSPEMQMPGATADPNSIGAVAQAAQVLQAQAVADSQYDPAVPARPKSASGFTNPQPSILLILIVIVVALALYFYVRRMNPITLIVGLCLKPVLRFLRL